MSQQEKKFGMRIWKLRWTRNSHSIVDILGMKCSLFERKHWGMHVLTCTVHSYNCDGMAFTRSPYYTDKIPSKTYRSIMSAAPVAILSLYSLFCENLRCVTGSVMLMHVYSRLVNLLKPLDDFKGFI